LGDAGAREGFGVDVIPHAKGDQHPDDSEAGFHRDPYLVRMGPHLHAGAVAYAPDLDCDDHVLGATASWDVSTWGLTPMRVPSLTLRILIATIMCLVRLLSSA